MIILNSKIYLFILYAVQKKEIGNNWLVLYVELIATLQDLFGIPFISSLEFSLLLALRTCLILGRMPFSRNLEIKYLKELLLYAELWLNRNDMVFNNSKSNTFLHVIFIGQHIRFDNGPYT